MYTFSDYHGYYGPLKIIDAAETPELTKALFKAADELGDFVTDVNGKKQEGRKSRLVKCQI